MLVHSTNDRKQKWQCRFINRTYEYTCILCICTYVYTYFCHFICKLPTYKYTSVAFVIYIYKLVFYIFYIFLLHLFFNRYFIVSVCQLTIDSTPSYCWLLQLTAIQSSRNSTHIYTHICTYICVYQYQPPPQSFFFSPQKWCAFSRHLLPNRYPAVLKLRHMTFASVHSCGECKSDSFRQYVDVCVRTRKCLCVKYSGMLVRTGVAAEGNGSVMPQMHTCIPTTSSNTNNNTYTKMYMYDVPACSCVRGFGVPLQVSYFVCTNIFTGKQGNIHI